MAQKILFSDNNCEVEEEGALNEVTLEYEPNDECDNLTLPKVVINSHGDRSSIVPFLHDEDQTKGK